MAQSCKESGARSQPISQKCTANPTQFQPPSRQPQPHQAQASQPQHQPPSDPAHPLSPAKASPKFEKSGSKTKALALHFRSKLTGTQAPNNNKTRTPKPQTLSPKTHSQPKLSRRLRLAGDLGDGPGAKLVQALRGRTRRPL